LIILDHTAAIALAHATGCSPGWPPPPAGNGYWQRYLQFDGPSYLLGESNDNQWINSCNGHYNDYSHIPGGQFNGGIIWGKSTNWRVDCYVQAQAQIDAPDEAYTMYSPTKKVC
jgi:hypothetical protein